MQLSACQAAWQLFNTHDSNPATRGTGGYLKNFIIPMKPIVIIAEHHMGRIHPATDELATAVCRLQDVYSGDIRIVLLDENPDEMAEILARKTGMPVIAVRIPGMIQYNGEIYRAALTDLLLGWGPSHVVTAHTTQGLDFAPGLAVRLGTVCITGVGGVRECNGQIAFTRAVFGGKLVADVISDSACTILSVLPGSFAPYATGSAMQSGGVERLTMDIRPVKTLSGSIAGNALNTAAIDTARVIVAVGRGIMDQDNLNLVHRLAAMLPGCAVGGSRIVCDLGWLNYEQQIGVTGRTVSPDIYIACGISGAIQHVAGMKGSGFVVAINSDPAAAIFNMSDVCIVEDIITFIPLLIAAYENRHADAS